MQQQSTNKKRPQTSKEGQKPNIIAHHPSTMHSAETLLGNGPLAPTLDTPARIGFGADNANAYGRGNICMAIGGSWGSYIPCIL